MAPKAKKSSYSYDAFHLTRWSGAMRLTGSPPLTYWAENHIPMAELCLIEKWWDSTHTFHIVEQEMTVTPYDFYCMIGLSFEGAIISLDNVLGIQLGLNMLGRKYSIETIRYFDLVSDYMLLPQRTTEKCVHMAKAFLLHLLGAYTEGQLGAACSLENCIILQTITLQTVILHTPWAGQPLLVTRDLELAAPITLEITRPLKGEGLRALYLAERVRCQLGGPITDEPIDPQHLPWTVYAYGLNGFARKHAMPCNPNVMGYLLPPNTRAPIIQEHEELVWLARNLKLEVTNYSRELYGSGGVAHPGSGDDDDDDRGDKEDSKMTLSYQPRKRRHQ
ncbi:hypothetical protein SO802_002485 [Lithocarpus litseifolius]|uniref:Aminotransferase-like plant mobile domain-containing protein n=1 Tax=Lithocarpus litseifolius TaxID=425828 RepID=A0AAW2DYA9_9ROSI